MAVYVRERCGKYRMEYMLNGTKYSKTIKMCSKSALEKEKAKFMMEVEEKNNPHLILFRSIC